MKLYINGKKCDVKEGSRIAMTYQVNNIAELKDRQSNYSNTIKLPMTQNNRDIIGALDDISVVNRIPYEQNTATLEEGGTDIVPDGKAIITNAGDEYQANVLSGNVNFFDAIKGKSIKDLDLSAYNHVWNTANAAASRFNTSGYIWGLCDCGALTNTDRIYRVDKSIPSVFAHTIVDKIFTEAGYTKAGDFWDSNFFKAITIPCTDMTTIRRKQITLTTTFSTLYTNMWRLYMVADGEGVTLEGFRITFKHIIAGSSVYVMDAANLSTIAGDTFIPPFERSNQLGLVIRPDGGGNPGYIDDFPAPNSGAPLFLPFPGGTNIEITIVADLVSNTTDNRNISFHLRAPFDVSRVNVGGTTLFEGFHPNATIDIAESLPDIPQDEFIKIFMQMAALVSQPDKYGDVVTFERFDKISENITSAIDLSDKIDLSTKPDIQFTIGSYAQENIMKYDNDENLADDLGSGSILIDNLNLPKSKELFRVKYSASESVKRLIDYTLLRIRCIDENGELTVQPKERITLLNIISSASNPITYADGVNVDEAVSTNIPILYFDGGTYSLSFKWLINNFYKTLEGILTDTKVVNCSLLLSDRFIADLNHFIPVYLRKFGNYFYINIISNYISGKATKTQLIRL